MANSKPKCKYCKEYVSIETGFKAPAGWFCNYSHASKFAQEKQRKQREKAVKAKVKADKKDLRERKLAIKPKKKWEDELQDLFNKYVRLRDANLGCVSCDKPFDWYGQWHASHYHSRGSSTYLRYNLWNVHKSCSVCNKHLSGNIGEYTPRLIEKIGQEKFDWLLRHKYETKSFDIEWIKRAIKICRKAVKREQKKAEL